MVNVNRLKISTRIRLGLGAVIALLLAVAVLGIVKIEKINDSTEIILHDRFVKVGLAHRIENEVNAELRAVRTALILSESAEINAELSKLDASALIVANAIAQLRETVRTERGKAALAILIDARAQFKAQQEGMIELIRNGKAGEMREELVARIRPVQTSYLAAVEQFAKTQIDGMEQFGKDAATAGHDARISMMVLSVVAVALALAIAVVLGRSIILPISEAVKVAETVASGDLTANIVVNSQDETGQLLAALRKMNASLLNIVGQVRMSCESISTGSSEVAIGSADLSQRTEEQASNLQQTASAMEELTATVQRSADTAREATSLASSASDVAVKGGQMMAEVVSTMKEISASSHKIAEITGVIDGIAFQTNILALNAAVEAARAGEHGRGFAVVAGEVRTLAQRAATAAKEIKVLIGESVSRVEDGSRQVSGAGSTMADIVRQVQQVAQLITEMGNATEQQSLGIAEISRAVNQLDEVTQQNAALVEESAAAADSLNEQARRLTDVVNTFKVA